MRGYWNRRLTRRSLLQGALQGAAAVATLGLWSVGNAHSGSSFPREFAAAGRLGRPSSTAQLTPRWTQHVPRGPRPSPRRDHSLTFDGDRGVLYLYGGRLTGPDRRLSDLWRFDLSTLEWEEIQAQGRIPPPRFGHNAEYDRVGQRLVVALGLETVTDSLNDVWTFDPETASWAELGAGSQDRPAPRYGAGGSYDEDGGRIFVTHGFTIHGRFDDTWFFDLASESWIGVPTTAPAPIPRCLLRAGWEPSRQELLLFGGQSNVAPFHGDFWSLDMASGVWTEHFPSESPASRFHFGAAFRESALQWYLFGGRSPDGLTADLWAYDAPSGLWSAIEPPAEGRAPSPRLSHDMVWADGTMYLFGGNDGGTDLDDLWVLDLG